MKYLFLLCIIFSISSCSSKKKDNFKHLKNLTLGKDTFSEEKISITNFSSEYFDNKYYILDLYFILANDAFYMGCYKIAHNGFVFLYNNDDRPGTKEFIENKFKLMRKILEARNYFAQKGLLKEFDQQAGISCDMLQSSLDE